MPGDHKIPDFNLGGSPIKVMGFTDQTRYLNMIKNRPVATLIPQANKRILAARTGTSLFANIIIFSTLFGMVWNQARQVMSATWYTQRRKFSFKSDPYSGTVNCTYQQVPYKPQGY